MLHFDLPDHQIENDKNYYLLMKIVGVSEYLLYSIIITNKFSKIIIIVTTNLVNKEVQSSSINIKVA